MNDAKQKILSNAQSICLDILDEFIDVCDKNNLSWFADSGTLLGAIRHGGFIPWDDDVDVVMPRKDYDFLHDNPQLFSKPYVLMTETSAASNFQLCMQLADESTTKLDVCSLSTIEKARKEKEHFRFSHSVSIDIVPLDNAPSDKELATLHHFCKALLHYWTLRYYSYSEYNAFLDRQSYKAAVRFFNDTMKKISYVNRNSDRLMASSWLYADSCKPITKKEAYSKSLLLPFKGLKHLIRVPAGYDEVLRQYYGDYMTPVKTSEDHIELNAERITAIFDALPSAEYERFSNEQLIQMISEGRLLSESKGERK